MKKLLFLILLIPSLAYADVTQSVEWRETDGSPSVFDPYQVNVSNGTLTDNTGGVITIATGGGNPSGSNLDVQVNDAGSFFGEGLFRYYKSSNTLVISRDVGQSGEAIRISSDTGVSLAAISHDGSASFSGVNAGGGTSTFTTVNGAIDMGGATSLEVPNGASPTVDAFGELAGDNDLWAASRGAPVFYDGTASTALVNVLVSDAPSNGQVPKWNTGGTITWEADTGTAQIDLNFPVQSAKLSEDAGVRIDGGFNGGVTPYVIWRLLFEDGKNDLGKNIALWQGRMPDNYAGGALTANIDYVMISTDTSNVTFGVSIWAITSNDAVSVTTESFDTENTKTQGASTTVSRDQTVSIALTNADSIAAGDWFMVKLRRDGSDAIAGDAAVIAFSVTE